MKHVIDDFMRYLDDSPTSYQAAEQSVSRLAREGFVELKEDAAFSIQRGGKYYVCRNNSAVIAFVIGKESPCESGFHLAASHLDSPQLKLKPETLKQDKGIWKVVTEVYGGPIVHTWTDRELGIAGKVCLKNGESVNSRIRTALVNLRQALAIIPNAAIHLNRDINKGFEYNKQTQLQAILSTCGSTENPLKELIAKELELPPDSISEMDLFLYDVHKASLVGFEKDIITSGRLDNLAMSHAIIQGIISAKDPVSTSVAVLYDNEEIGSQTLQGANSSFLTDVLERISLALNMSREDYLISLSKSFLISADMAHAYHPGYAEKHDPAYAPMMNQGPVIKMNANFRYSTTSETAAVFIRHCEKSGVKYQKFMTRSDLPCGSTIGPVASSMSGIRTVDIGNPMWAMHSIRESCGVQDHLDLVRVLGDYFSE